MIKFTHYNMHPIFFTLVCPEAQDLKFFMEITLFIVLLVMVTILWQIYPHNFLATFLLKEGHICLLAFYKTDVNLRHLPPPLPPLWRRCSCLFAAMRVRQAQPLPYQGLPSAPAAACGECSGIMCCCCKMHRAFPQLSPNAGSLPALRCNLLQWAATPRVVSPLDPETPPLVIAVDGKLSTARSFQRLLNRAIGLAAQLDFSVQFGFHITSGLLKLLHSACCILP